MAREMDYSARRAKNQEAYARLKIFTSRNLNNFAFVNIVVYMLFMVLCVLRLFGLI